MNRIRNFRNIVSIVCALFLAGAMYAHVIIGLIVGVLAALDLWIVHNRPVSTT